MRITQIQQILEIARSQSISQASRNLFISQPALSTMLQEFETEIGVQLFQRTKSGVLPTADGALILDSMNTIMHEIEYMQSFSKNSEELTGDFTLAIGASYEFLYSDIIQRFKESFPKANLKTINYAPNISDLISKGIADLALMPLYDEKGIYYSKESIFNQYYKNLTVLPLSTIHACAVLHPGHQKSNAAAIRFSELVDEQLVFGKQYELWQIQKYLNPTKYPITNIDRATALELLDRNCAILLDSYSTSFHEYTQRYPNYKVLPIIGDVPGLDTTWETYFIYRTTNNKLQRLFINELKQLLQHYGFSLN